MVIMVCQHTHTHTHTLSLSLSLSLSISPAFIPSNDLPPHVLQQIEDEKEQERREKQRQEWDKNLCKVPAPLNTILQCLSITEYWLYTTGYCILLDPSPVYELLWLARRRLTVRTATALSVLPLSFDISE